MSVFGSPIVQSAAGINQAQRNTVRDAEKKRQAQQPTRARATDEVEVQTSQTTGAVRGLMGNAREETSSDRKRHGTTTTRPDADRPRLDVKG